MNFINHRIVLPTLSMAVMLVVGATPAYAENTSQTSTTSTKANSECLPNGCSGITEGKVKGKIKSPGDKGMHTIGQEGGAGMVIATTTAKTIDVNTANPQDLVILMGVSPQTAQAIVAERSKGLFANSTDFAERLCAKYSINSGFEAAVKIQNEFYAPKSGDPKAAGWKCVAGQSTYEISGKKHNYVGHVTLLR